MKFMTTNEIRRSYLEFFEKHGHKILEPKSLIPNNDKTLLWINSGVAAIKPYFDGSQKAPAKRLVNSQKSIRTNDIENVGVTARHHTMFEMMGNFSIGDYFKEEGIKLQWEFLTKVIGLDADKLYVTVYEKDAEAYRIWKEVIGLEDFRIIKNGKDLNFWEIGAGPCGPNTEVFFDRGEKYDTEKVGLELLIKDLENDRYLEVVNVVFSEFNSDGTGNTDTYKKLPQQNIDTGLGLERLATIVQEVPTNYDTDTFKNIIKEIEKHTEKRYDQANYFETDSAQEEINIAFKVIADHVRANVFAISDGAIPSNKDRGYVLRRIIRRAVKWSRKLNVSKPILADIVDVVVSEMKDYYPYLEGKKEFVKEILNKEEVQFLKTIEKGQELLNAELAKTETLDGKVAFRLFDTFGFPIELTQEFAAEQNKDVDLVGYEQAFENHKNIARAAHKSSDSMSTQNEELMKLEVETNFVGYDKLSTDAKVIWTQKQEDGNLFVILDNTTMYAESGGQVSDTGSIGDADVISMFKGPKGEHVHVIKGSLNIGDQVTVTAHNRDKIINNHTATHLLHKALKEVVGNDIAQAGSHHDGDRLRFDITSINKITKEDTIKVENRVNELINKNIDVKTEVLSMDDAKAKGAIGLFEAKYGELVRVVSIDDYSIELCGGVHVKNTANIQNFAITNVESKGSGVYRIEAITTNEKITTYFTAKISDLDVGEFAPTREGYENSLVAAETKNKEEMAKAKELAKAASANAFEEYSQMDDKVEIINGKNVLKINTSNIDSKVLKEIADHYKNKMDVVVILTDTSDKITFVVGVSKDYIAQGVKAGAIVKELSNGRGGGKPDMAQGGLQDVNDLDAAMAKIGGLI